MNRQEMIDYLKKFGYWILFNNRIYIFNIKKKLKKSQKTQIKNILNEYLKGNSLNIVFDDDIEIFELHIKVDFDNEKEYNDNTDNEISELYKVVVNFVTICNKILLEV